MSKVGCKVIQDLMPLYIDDIVSDETKELVEEHIKECETCQQELSILKEISASDFKIEEAYDDTNVIRSLKQKIRRKQIIIALVVLVIAVVSTLGGVKVYLNMTRPDLNGNEIIASSMIAPDGAPTKLLEYDVNDIIISKDMGKVFISLPVNNSKMKQCHIQFVLGEEILEDKKVPISKARFATFCLENVGELKSGLYDLIFYDSKDNICQYVWFTIKE